MCWLISERLIVLACMLCSCQCVRVFVSQKQKLEAVLEEREYELEALPAWVCPRPLPSCGHTTSSHRRRFSSPVKRLRRLCAYARGQTPRSQKGGEARHLVPHMPPARLPPSLSQGFVRHALKSRHSSDHTCDHQSCSLPAARVALSPIPPRMKLLCRRVVQCLKRPCVSVWS